MLDQAIEIDTPVFVMIHEESTGNSSFDYPDGDEPLTENGRIVTVQVDLAAPSD